MKKEKDRTRLMAKTAIFTGLASVLHAIEALIPIPYVIPGAKLGLANTVALYMVMTAGFWPAMAVSFLRTLIGSLLSGTFLSVGYYLSLSGALLSTVTMYLCHRYLKESLSAVGVSVIGALTHNVTQLVVAGLILSQPGVFFYLPYLLVFAIPAGVFIGLLVNRTIRGTSRIME